MDSVATGPFWSLHTHSKYSFNDALPGVDQIVDAAVRHGYPALGLTDHGNVPGAVELYRGCRKNDIEPLPGIELYVVPDTEYAGRSDRLHLTVAAYTEKGYRNLMRLATLSSERFWYGPRVDMADFAAMAEAGATDGLLVATGCYFGLVPQVVMSRGTDAGVNVVKTLQSWFPRVYVEVQNHGIDTHKGGDKQYDFTDDELNELMWDVAQEASAPMVVTRDSHYVDEGDRHLHESLKRLVSWSEDPDDAVFPGGGYYMTDTQGMKPWFEPHILRAGLEGLTEIANAAYVRIPELERFTLQVPDVTPGKDPDKVLEEKVMAAYAASPEANNLEMLHQLRHELDVNRAQRMSPYTLLVDMVCEFMRERKIRYHARGSAAGSAINYYLGISQVNPLRFALRFDRYMSGNRMKPPDVDLDVEHARRDEVIAFLQKHWSVRSVGSHMKYSLFDDDELAEDESKGSLRVRYYSTLRKKGIEDPPLWRNIPKSDRDELHALAALKLISGYGTHAAGYIVAPDETVVEHLPMAYIASSKKLVTMYGKKQIELLGLLKLDLLGLRTSTAIRVMCSLADVDWESIPDNDPDTMRMISIGLVGGVFQLDGGAMRRGVQALKPRNIEDLIAAQALFRPATLNSGATDAYLARRRKTEPVPERHSDIMSATKETYGVLLYQEQVMDVMETLGLDSTQREEMLDAVKASNEYTAGARRAIQEMLPVIKELATGRGWTQIDIDWLTEGLEAYADYSFNKAHAASYGIVAYRTAYMRRHHPVEFWTGMLQAYADSSKPKGRPHKTVTYIATARREDQVRVFPAHVNRSSASFTMDRNHNAVRKGLRSIPRVGAVAAKELELKAPFTSLNDLGKRVLPLRVTGAKHLALGVHPAECGGIITALHSAGALEGLEFESAPSQQEADQPDRGAGVRANRGRRPAKAPA